MSNAKKEFALQKLKNEISYNSERSTDLEVINSARKAIEFAYKNFKEPEEVYEGNTYRYEIEITNIALGIDAHLQRNRKNKKSPLIKEFVLDIINDERYGTGRDGFILLLYILKMDNELKEIATERKDFWETPRIDFQLIYALFKRKVQGFGEQAQKLILDNPKETELKNQAKKYIDKYGTIQPSRPMTVEEYQQALAETQESWERTPCPGS